MLYPKPRLASGLGKINNQLNPLPVGHHRLARGVMREDKKMADFKAVVWMYTCPTCGQEKEAGNVEEMLLFMEAGCPACLCPRQEVKRYPETVDITCPECQVTYTVKGIFQDAFSQENGQGKCWKCLDKRPSAGKPGEYRLHERALELGAIIKIH